VGDGEGDGAVRVGDGVGEAAARVGDGVGDGAARVADGVGDGAARVADADGEGATDGVAVDVAGVRLAMLREGEADGLTAGDGDADTEALTAGDRDAEGEEEMVCVAEEDGDWGRGEVDAEIDEAVVVVVSMRVMRTEATPPLASRDCTWTVKVPDGSVQIPPTTRLVR